MKNKKEDQFLKELLQKETKFTYIGEVKDTEIQKKLINMTQMSPVIIATLNACDTGHPGGLTTISTNGPKRTLKKHQNQKSGMALDKINNLRKNREDRLNNLSGQKSKRGRPSHRS